MILDLNQKWEARSLVKQNFLMAHYDFQSSQGKMSKIADKKRVSGTQ